MCVEIKKKKKNQFCLPKSRGEEKEIKNWKQGIEMNESEV